MSTEGQGYKYIIILAVLISKMPLNQQVKPYLNVSLKSNRLQYVCVMTLPSCHETNVPLQSGLKITNFNLISFIQTI
jgi:hypothetical protein